MKRIEAPISAWTIQVQCTGSGWNQNGKRPCGTWFELNEMDICARAYNCFGEEEIDYGFWCEDCGCFTGIAHHKIPADIKDFATKRM